MNSRSSILMLGALAAVACADRGEPPATVLDGNADRGRQEIARLQCGACHRIPGIRAARGAVGPTLEGFANRPSLAGKWPNQADHLIAWLLDPPALAPHTAMPAVVRDPQSARDIAAYLYTLD
jgi:sulfur-oxidizing protein SoxX